MLWKTRPDSPSCRLRVTPAAGDRNQMPETRLSVQLRMLRVQNWLFVGLQLLACCRPAQIFKAVHQPRKCRLWSHFLGLPYIFCLVGILKFYHCSLGCSFLRPPSTLLFLLAVAGFLTRPPPSYSLWGVTSAKCSMLDIGTLPLVRQVR